MRRPSLARAPSGRQLRQPRLAELVAEELRRRISNGDLHDGDILPKLEQLLKEFQVSRPSLREAQRILETEGLITVRRGNVGGAIVHTPGNRNAAYMIGLVLQARSVGMEDLLEAIKQVEPVCASLCAARPDRPKAVVPKLRAIEIRMRRDSDDGKAFAEAGREFHEALVALCGNETVKVVVGALGAVWSTRRHDGRARGTTERSSVAGGSRASALRAYERLVAMIEEGDEAGAALAAIRVLEITTLFASAEAKQTISAAAVRE